MGWREDLQAAFEAQYRSTVNELKAWFDSNTRHGCFCGAGADCTTPIDGLDQCCAQHDADYGSLGYSFETMWSLEALIDTRFADEALARCAAGATLADPGTEHANEDPETYRGRLIWLFETRASIGETLHTWRERFRALQNFRDWLLSSSQQLQYGDPDAVSGTQQHIDHLRALGVDEYEIRTEIAAVGIDPNTAHLA